MIEAIMQIITVVEGLQTEAADNAIQLHQAKMRYLAEAAQAESLLGAIATNQKLMRRVLDNLTTILERLRAGEEVDPADWWKSGETDSPEGL